jgi:Zn-dependent M28 family amino/carboxypeptidase
MLNKLLLLCCLLVISSCAWAKALVVAVRPFQASAIRGQDPTPASEEAREHFVSQEALLDDVTYLAAPDCEGRAAGSRGNALAREYIKKRMSESGLTVQEQAFTYERPDQKTGAKTSSPGVNVLGVLPGSNAQAPWLVIGAHYDHLGYSESRRDFYSGADDNAAGVAALFALAKYFSQHTPTHTTLFIAFDAEELGAIGANRFLKESTVVPRESIAFYLNLDMISRSKKRELFAVTHYVPAQEPIRALLFALQPEVGYRLMVSRDDKSQAALASDHFMFLMANIPFIYLGVVNHSDYHRVSDKVEKIDPAFYTAVVDSCVLMIQRLDAYLPLKMPPTE